MKRFRWVLVVVGAVLLAASLYVAPLLAAQRAGDAAGNATRAAIKSAQAAESGQQSEQALHELLATEQGVESLVQYVASVQNGPQAVAAREATAYYLAILKAICAADRCVAPPLPKGL